MITQATDLLQVEVARKIKMNIFFFSSRWLGFSGMEKFNSSFISCHF